MLLQGITYLSLDPLNFSLIIKNIIVVQNNTTELWLFLRQTCYYLDKENTEHD